MSHSFEERVVALAGVFQAASLVDSIAYHGNANTVFIENSVESLFRQDATEAADVFGGVIGVQHGLRTLRDEFASRQGRRNILITRYVVSLLALERKLSSRPEMLERISDGLETMEQKMEFFSLEHENTFTGIAELYRETISTIGPKIIVEGEQHHLDKSHNASRIRALLLAGIRSAVLWRQCGGSRWQVLFSRQRYIDTARTLLA